MKAILFDLDNTLIDFMTMKKRCTEAAVTAMIDAGLNMKKETAYKKMFEMYEEHGIEDQRIFEKFLRKYMNKIDYKVLSAAIVAYRKVKLGQLSPYPDQVGRNILMPIILGFLLLYFKDKQINWKILLLIVLLAAIIPLIHIFSLVYFVIVLLGFLLFTF